MVAYTSRSLSKSEKNYSVIQQECLAVVYSLKQFRHCLLGHQFTVVTDHEPLQWLSNQVMIAWWTVALQEFSFNIKHRKGVNNGNANGLSRRTPHR